MQLSMGDMEFRNSCLSSPAIGKQKVFIVFDQSTWNPYVKLGDCHMRVLFLGTPGIVIPVLKSLLKEHDVVGVVTQPHKVSTKKLPESVYDFAKFCKP